MTCPRALSSAGLKLSVLGAAVFLAAAVNVMASSGAAQALPDEPLARGKALLLQGKYNDAKTSFEAALGKDPKNREARYYRGVAWLKLNKADAAWADFQATLQGDAGYALGHVGLAQVWIMRMNYPEAEKEIALALARDPACAEAYYQRGIILGYQKRIDEALAAFEKCLELDPLHAYAHYQAGLAYNQKRRKDLTIVHLDKFLTLAPLAPEAPQVRNLMNMLKR